MGRREDIEIHGGFDLQAFRLPSKRTLNLSRSEYHPFGIFYSRLRRWRRTWLPESKQPSISSLLAQVEELTEKARLISVPEELRLVFDSMLNLAPVLIDHSNGWQRFEAEMQRMRERFAEGGPSPRLFAHNQPGRSVLLSRLNSIRKALHSESPIEQGLLSLLFAFARAVGAREKWKIELNRWERGVRGARSFELDSFVWGHRDCLIEARYQMIVLGRSLVAGNPNSTFNRTKVKNRASIIHTLAHSRQPIVLHTLIRDVRKCRRKVQWEAYLNKLPCELFPKKHCA